MRLDDVKAGDWVAVHGVGWILRIEKCQVTRTTVTRIFIGNTAYSRKSGHPVGAGAWSQEFIEAWDEQKHGEQLAEYANRRKLAQVRSRLRDFDWNSLDMATAQEVLAIIETKDTK